MKFQPMGNRVFVDSDEVTTTSGGLYVPQTASTGPKKGTVAGCGPFYMCGETRVECPYKPGDRVLCDDLHGMKITVEGKEYLVIRNEDIVGLLNDKEAA